MKLFLIFIIYSIIGYIGEVMNIFIKTHKFLHRGFLIGPYLPVYGVGALIILIINKYVKNIYLFFFICVLLFSLLEYFTSYIIEKLFNIRLWDYSKYKYNLNGRICLNKIVQFGICGLISVYLINPIIYKIINKVDNKIIYLIIILFVLDMILSLILTGKIKLKKKKNKDNTEEVSNKVKNEIKNEMKKDIVD